MKYASPQVKVVELKAQHMLCQSVRPEAGTESFVMNGSTYDDSDFE